MKSFRSCGVLVLAIVTLNLQTNYAANLVWTNLAGGTGAPPPTGRPTKSPPHRQRLHHELRQLHRHGERHATIANLTLGDTNATGIQKLTVSAGTFTVTNLTAGNQQHPVALRRHSRHLGLGPTARHQVNQAAGTWQLNTPININTYNLTNGELRGANCVITNFNWLGGSAKLRCAGHDHHHSREWRHAEHFQRDGQEHELLGCAGPGAHQPRHGHVERRGHLRQGGVLFDQQRQPDVERGLFAGGQRRQPTDAPKFRHAHQGHRQRQLLAQHRSPEQLGHGEH
jgi:hypothetical protein